MCKGSTFFYALYCSHMKIHYVAEFLQVRSRSLKMKW